jgi:hypothetical protein
MKLKSLYLFHFSKNSVQECACENCGNQAAEIVYVEKRASGPYKESINNLIALCPGCVKLREKKMIRTEDLIQKHKTNLIKLIENKQFNR